MMTVVPALVPRDAADDSAEFLTGLGRRVREARARRGLSRKALSLEARVSERYLAQLEAGEGNASVMLLRRVAVALGATLPELLGEDSPEHRLIRRFLDELPAHRLEDALFRLMREFGRDDAARRSRIALLGLRGAGKTTLGHALARENHWPFVELDREIEREAAVGLSELFMLHGQSGYRRIERRCLERVIEANDRMVMAVGGGIVSEPETFHLLLDRCFTVWVKAEPEEHMARVVAQGDFRPMAGSQEAMADLSRILAAREPLYRKADAIVDTSGDEPAQSLAALRTVLKS
jgi:XRE family transcriptional regulator, aerobic/anaerobic benzoate catabolism transcriptional regulator